MKQYYEVKATHPDALLLFRVGDFYETFSEDAIAASKILGITLTQRKNGGAATVELAGFPYHSLDTYLPRLVRAGLRVAICEQLEDPKSAKGIVKRGVTELVSPGLTLNEKVLDSVSAHYLACIGTEQQGDSGLAFLDISTGDFFAGQGDESFLKQMISAFQPREILLPRGLGAKPVGQHVFVPARRVCFSIRVLRRPDSAAIWSGGDKRIWAGEFAIGQHIGGGGVALFRAIAAPKPAAHQHHTAAKPVGICLDGRFYHSQPRAGALGGARRQVFVSSNEPLR